MSLKEWVAGGEKVQRARNRISDLESRSRLSGQQEINLAEARRITRRHAISRIVAFGGLTLGSAIAAPIIVPEIVKALKDDELASTEGNDSNTRILFAEWRSKSASDRLKYLESKGLESALFPADTDSFKELSLAVAQIFCEQVDCEMTAEVMASKVQIFSTRAEFAERINPSADPKTRYMLEDDIMETVLDGSKAVLFNEHLINEFVNRHKGTPGLEKSLGSKVDTKSYESILFHAYSHVNDHPAERDLPAVYLRDTRINVQVEVNKSNGFLLMGRDENGDEIGLTGFNEASTDLVAVYVSRNFGRYFSPANYGTGVNLITKLNVKSGITAKEFSEEYFKGDPSRIFRRWAAISNPANPDLKDAVFLALTISLAVDNFIDEDQANRIIDEYINSPKIK